MPVYILGTLDTKGTEIQFVRDLLHAQGLKTCVVDTGSLGQPVFPADVTREAVFTAAGASLEQIRQQADRGQAITHSAIGVANLVAKAYAEGKVEGVLSLGGSAGTTIGTSAMRALPLGIPKLMVSTLASGQTRPYVGGKDILMMNAVADIAGLNRISRPILTNAANAMAGMVRARQSATRTEPTSERPLIAATMFGVTTPCVEKARQVLEQAGYEVIVFHATGNGGEAMEGLISDGVFAGVLDVTTTELADELVGGILTAGPTRLTAAGRKGIPQVISVGALDMVNFGPPNTVPEKFKDRKFYQHNPTVTLMRTTVEENRKLGEEIGRKAAAATGPTCIMIPLKGVSAIDQAGKAFDDPNARLALVDGIRVTHGDIELVELDHHINDVLFAEAVARRLMGLIER